MYLHIHTHMYYTYVYIYIYTCSPAQLELFELILLSKVDEHFPVERFEATVSQSAVPSLPLTQALRTAPKP